MAMVGSPPPPKRDDDNIARVRFPSEAARNADARRRSKQTAGVPLAQIIKPRLKDIPELIVHHRPQSPAAECFRQLSRMLDASRPQAPQAVVVTSAGDGEGKSFVALNLALAYAARGEGRVMLLEANLRRPSVAQRIAPQPKLGLAELLAGGTDMTHVLFESANSPLHLLPAGDPCVDPLELLGTDRFERLIGVLRGRFQRIVIDTPPIIPFTDADLVARSSDGVLVVARAGQTRRGVLAQAISSVTSAPVLGTLLNELGG
jgi:capsular exopolysaccharide synthesis family protein